ncbi:hypothetical protein K3X44_08095 [Aliiroseovarius crassostreae]|uniref:hypothetical protein n=1 Tax=Aliiroseovarius crassostreae TaxID=154981 RepID=UPI00220A4C8A|nr:hypothetical protein [Aliiroseovarius crassostreae]UWQ00512.1 hypothetical protein K3X44_08095 [Aliiroseovarius crassostreae]
MNFKKLSLISALVLGLAGCNAETQQAMKDGLRSGTALERFAASGSFVVKSEQHLVQRSKAQIMSALEDFSSRCLSVSVKYGRFPGDAAAQIDYVPIFTNEDGTTRHVLFRKIGGHSTLVWSKGGKGFNAAVSTRIEPVNASSTKLTIAATVGLSSYVKALVAAARGESIVCPKLP